MLGWARQTPGAPGHKALARIVEQLTRLRAVGLDPDHGDDLRLILTQKLLLPGVRAAAAAAGRTAAARAVC